MKRWHVTIVAWVGLAALGCDRIEALKDQLFGASSASEQENSEAASIRELYESGDCAGALQKIDEVTQTTPESAEAFYYKGLCHLAHASASPTDAQAPFSEEEQAGLAAFQRALAANPRYALASVGVGDVYARRVPSRPRRRPSEDPSDPYVLAIAAYRKAVAIDPKLPEAQHHYGRFLERTGQLVDAEAAYKAAAEAAATVPELAPDHYVAYGRFLAGPAGRLEDALDQYELAQMFRQDDPVIRQEMAIVYSRLGLRHLEKQEYLFAEKALTKAQGLFSDQSVPQAQKNTDALAELRMIRRR